jgi:hypothetical protein
VSRLFRLFLPRITFRITAEDGECLVEQEIQIRAGPIGRALNRRQLAAVQRHMREEGENMKRMLEGEVPGSRSPSATSRPPAAKPAGTM